MQHHKRLLTCCLIAALACIGQLMPVAQHSVSAADEECFAETGHCVAEPFLSYWREHGGLAINGYPISDVFQQKLDDGKTYDVQYFERARFELHPENAGTPYLVLLGQFGRALYSTDQRIPLADAVEPIPLADFFPETGHNLRGEFRDYWHAHGGLAQFGYPISEVIRERLENGEEYYVQYFERARFELHPENAAPYNVLLGQFGRRVLSALTPPSTLPFPVTGRHGSIYQNEIAVRARLLLPTAGESQQTQVSQGFEHGWMIWLQGSGKIYVLFHNTDGYFGPWRVFEDTWVEGQNPGGGPAPVSGLYEPQRGFGKVWRENPEVRQRLGYAKSPDESVEELIVQPFGGGLMIENIAIPGIPYSNRVTILYDHWRYEVRR